MILILNLLSFILISLGLYMLFNRISSNTHLTVALGPNRMLFGGIVFLIRFLFPFNFPSPIALNLYIPLSKFTTKNLYLNTFKPMILFLFLIWISISIVKAFKKVLAYRSFHEYLWGISHINFSIEKVSNIATNLIKKYHIKSDITLIQSHLIQQPFVLGVRKPIIAIPIKKYSDNELNFILKHELTHIKHNDSILKIFLEFLDILYWWNPFIHKLIAEMHKLIEVKCDLSVSKNLSEQEKIDYLSLLLRESQDMKLKNNYLPIFSLTTNSKSFLIQRFNAIFYHKTISNFYLLIFSVIIIIFVLILFLLQIVLFFY